MQPGRCKALAFMSRDKRRAPGFRFWWWDGLTIVAGVFLAWLAWPLLGKLALVFPVTLAHFFLFCNVFRLRRNYELVWTGAFLVNLGYWILFRELGWVEVLAVQTPVTLILIAAEARSSRYHGVFWEKVNPELEASRSKG